MRGGLKTCLRCPKALKRVQRSATNPIKYARLKRQSSSRPEKKKARSGRNEEAGPRELSPKDGPLQAFRNENPRFLTEPGGK